MDGRLCAVYRYGRLSGKIYESGGPGEYHPVAGKKQQGKLSGPGGKKPVPGAAPAGKKGRDAPAGKKTEGLSLFYAPLPPPPGTSGGNRFVFRDHLVFVASRMGY